MFNILDKKGTFPVGTGACSKLQSITLGAASTETAMIGDLVVLLSTLRNPAELYRIPLYVRSLSPSAVEPHRDPSKLSRIGRILRGGRAPNNLGLRGQRCDDG